MPIPKVSVLVATYKHERFIAEALDGALMQQADFDYEIVVGDDCSPDRTGEIVREYASRHPGRIRALPRDHNLGGRTNWLDLYANCRGEYIAYLDGDDYWTSPHKLRRQVELLEARPDLAMCFHPSLILKEETGERLPYGDYTQSQYALADLAARNFIPTSAVLVRNGIMLPVPPLARRAAVGDWVFHVLAAMRGNIGFLHETMAVYRLHVGGVFYGLLHDLVARLATDIETCDAMADYVGPSRRDPFDRANRRRSLELVEELLRRGEHARAAAEATKHWPRFRGLARERQRMLLLRARAISPSSDMNYLAWERFLGRVKGFVKCRLRL